MAEDMEFLPREQILSLEELSLVGKAFVDLGVSKIRLTGGEPTVRKGIIDLASILSTLDGLEELTMTTNGVLLNEFAAPLAEAGISRINISIDSLKAERFKEMTRFGKLDDVLNGIEVARTSGFKQIKLNAVVMQGINDDEVVDLASYAIDRGLDISFIEEMPLGHVSSHNRSDTLTLSETIRKKLSNKYQLTATTEKTGGPSRYFRVIDSKSKIGFISPISDNFCSSCNRVRLTVEGQLLLCLGNEHSVDLRAVLRAPDFTEEKLQKAIFDAISIKPERHYFDPEETKIVRFMSATGG